ncbi:adhesion G protein-coupled receptor E3-like isoform X1 [Crotalus tigris]|uniref:adhesion G protein-coupled receptor E3-like isoform X1 n=1 Tax=Crotalus tigris TaxID=88082 RepID=UPI00192F1493|nr:adhesion G protein-coupled receptor E3-like isoform X1 [Crotalus tigris]
MKNLLTCIILGLGLAISCADGKGTFGESIRNFFMCKVFTVFGSKCERYPRPGSNNIISEKSPFDSQLEKVQKTLNSNNCSNEQKTEKNLYCSVMGPALIFLNPVGASDMLTESTLKDSVDSFEKLFDNQSYWDNNVKKDFVTILPKIMDYISLSALFTALANPGNTSRTVVRNFTVIQTNLISPGSFEKNETLELKAQGDQMVIHPRAATATTTDTVAVAFISAGGLESLLKETLVQNGTFPDNEMLTNVHMNSRLVSVSVGNKIQDISTPVNLTFQHLKNKVAQEKVLCVHLNFGALSEHGCQQLFSNITHTECSCQHLSSFAVLMATTHKHGDLILTIISYLGLSISVICLFLCIVTFLFCRSSHNNSTFIHLQLSFCLFFADLLFIIGIDKTGNKILCSIIAGMLKYLFLACFVWMFLEGVNLYLTVRNLKVANYSGTSKYMKICMYLIGYGFPVLIVAISATINPGAFGTLYRCWLNPDFIWSFIGPVCAIIVVNLVFFCLILRNLHKKLASLNSEISSIKNTRSLLFKAIAHVFILGVTWCLGLFQYGPVEDIMAYLFTITNSVQGIFIFLVYCLLNQKVREAYWHWICCINDSAPDVSEIIVTSFPIINPSANVRRTPSVVSQKIEWGNPT